MRFVVVLCIFSLLLRKGVQSIPLQDFYPFGPDAGDSAIDRNDDGSSPAVTLSSIFPFFDRNFQTIFVRFIYRAVFYLVCLMATRTKCILLPVIEVAESPQLQSI